MINIEVLKKCKINVITSSIQRLDITDEIYFSNQYSDYVSNSKLKLINPSEGGSFETFLKGLQSSSSSSFNLGTAVHELILQPDKFELSTQLKPSAKAGMMIGSVFKYRSRGYTIIESLIYASEEVNYYKDQLTLSRIKTLIKSGLNYYLYLMRTKHSSFEKEQIILDSRSRETCIKCIESIRRNSDATNLLYPDDFSLDSYLNQCEDTLILNIEIELPNSLDNPNAEIIKVPLKLKAKIDNWNLNIDEGVLNLNDLKTTGKAWYLFPGSIINETGEFLEGSFQHYHYYRQLAFYQWILSQYLKKEGYSWNRTYLNIISVQTIPNYACVVFKVPNKWFQKGMLEFKTLLILAAYAEYNKEILLS